MLKRLIRRVLSMCELSWYITLRTLMLCCAMAFCAFVLVIGAGDYSLATRDLYRLAEYMSEAPAALLLLFSIAAIMAEDACT